MQASGALGIAGGTSLIVTRYGHVFVSGGFGGGLKGWAVAGGSGWLGNPFDKTPPDSCTLDNFIGGWTFEVDVQLIGDAGMIYSPSTGQVGWATGAGYGLGASGMASWAQRIQ